MLLLFAALCIFYVKASRRLGHKYWSNRYGHHGTYYAELNDNGHWWNDSIDGRYEYEEKRAGSTCGRCRCTHVIDCSSASGIV